jgi:HEAT repeat protein
VAGTAHDERSTARVALLEGSRRASGAAGSPRQGSPQSWLGWLKRLWQGFQEDLKRLPPPIRWLLALAGVAIVSFASTNLLPAIPILFSKGFGPFLTYMGKEPFAPFAKHFPILFGLAAVFVAGIAIAGRIIKQQQDRQNQISAAKEGAKQALEEAGRIKDVPVARRTYLKEVEIRYRTIALPKVETDTAEVIVPLPLKRRFVARRRTMHTGTEPIDGERDEAEHRPTIAGQLLETGESDALDLLEACKRTRTKHVLVLGGPDSGKTAVLKLHVVRAARACLDGADGALPVPVYLSAPDVAAAPGLREALRETVGRLEADSRLADLFLEDIRAGNALVCIDNLDRVEPGRRTAVIDVINREAVQSKSTWLVATRGGGYRRGELASGGFSEWELQDLTYVPSGAGGSGEAKTALQSQLAQHLVMAFRRRGGQATNAESAQDVAKAFLTALDADPRASLWRGNPLLFSLAVISFADQGRLPAGRVELCRQMVDAVLEERDQGADPVEQRLMRRMLADLALWMYRDARPTFTLDDMLLFLWDVEQISLVDAAQVGSRMLRQGVLDDTGGGRWSFRYDVFLDYLAAVALAQRLSSQDGARQTAAQKLAAEYYPYGRWRDVLIMVVRLLVEEHDADGSRAALAWLQVLLDRHTSRYGDPASQGLLLALESLAELPELPAAWLEVGLADDVAETWIAQLQRAARERRVVKQELLLGQVGVLGAIDDGAVSAVAVPKLVAHFGDADPRVRETMAQAALAFGAETVAGNVLLALREGSDKERATAARVLVDLELDDRQQALTAALSDPFWGVRFIAIMGLAGEKSNEDVRAALEDQSVAVRLLADASTTLGERAGPGGRLARLLRRTWARDGLAFADERDEQALVRVCGAAIGVECLAILAESWLERQLQPDDRQNGADGASGDRATSREVIATIVTGVEQILRSGTRPDAAATDGGEAAQAGAAAASSSQDAGSAKDEAADRTARETALHALRALGILNEDVVRAIDDAIDDDNAMIRATALLVIAALTDLGAIDKRPVSERERALLRDDDEYVRAAALIRLARAERGSLAELKDRLGDKSGVVRGVALLLLSADAATANERSADAIALLIEQTRGAGVESIAAALGLLVARPPLSRDALLESLYGAKAPWLPVMLLGALGALGKLDGMVPSAAVANAVQHEDWSVRTVAGLVLEALALQGKLGGDVPADLLSAPLETTSPGTRVVGVLTLALVGIIGGVRHQDVVGRLLEQLDDKDPGVKIAVLLSLIVLAAMKKLEEPVPERQVLAALDDANPWVRYCALRAAAVLAENGLMNRRAVVDRIARLAGERGQGDRSAWMRASAALSLGDIATTGEKPDQSVLAHLKGSLGDPAWWVRVATALTWATSTRDVPAKDIIAAFGGRDGTWVRVGRAVALAATYEPSALVPMLSQLSAGDKKPSKVLNRTMRRLRRFGRSDQLTGALHDKARERRLLAVMALAVLDSVRMTLGDGDDAVRAVAALSLGLLSAWQGIADSDADPSRLAIVLAPLRQFTPDTAKELQGLLIGIGTALRPALAGPQIRPPADQIAGLVNDEHWPMRAIAVVEVGILGAVGGLSDAKQADSVVAALQDNNPWVRAAAALVLRSRFLEEFDPDWTAAQADEAIQGVSNLLDQGAQYLGAQLSSVIPLDSLSQALMSRFVWLRALGALIQGALASVSADVRARVGVERLVDSLEDDNWAVRWAALSAVGRLQGRVPIEALVKKLEDKDWRVRVAAVRALSRRDDQIPLRVLEDRLTDPAWYVRRAVVVALAAARDADGLIRALGDVHTAVQTSAALAISTLAERPRVDPLVAAFGDGTGYKAAASGTASGAGSRGTDASPTGDEASLVRVGAVLEHVGLRIHPGWVAGALDRAREQAWERNAVVGWLAIFGSMVELVVRGVRSGSWRARVLSALMFSVVSDPEIVEALTVAETDENMVVRSVARGMLERGAGSAVAAATGRDGLLDMAYVIGQDARDSGERAVRELADEWNRWVATAASGASLRVGPRVSPEMLRRLEALLQWPSWSVRMCAAEALGELGQPVRESTLRRLLDLRDSAEAPDEARAALDGALATLLPLVPHAGRV